MPDFKSYSIQGVPPSNATETGEIGIRGDQFATMFRGQRGQVRVRDQVRHGLPLQQHLLEDKITDGPPPRCARVAPGCCPGSGLLATPICGRGCDRDDSRRGSSNRLQTGAKRLIYYAPEGRMWPLGNGSRFVEDVIVDGQRCSHNGIMASFLVMSTHHFGFSGAYMASPRQGAGRDRLATERELR